MVTAAAVVGLIVLVVLALRVGVLLAAERGPAGSRRRDDPSDGDGG